MNNKERIISHNTRLQNISNELDTLPEYENIDSELDAQELSIADIKEALVGKVEGATATADTILEGYSAYVGQTLINGTYLPKGQYVWKKYNVGDYVEKTSLRNSNLVITTEPQNQEIRYHFSTSYTFDESTGQFTLGDGAYSDLSYGRSSVLGDKTLYYMIGTRTDTKMYSASEITTHYPTLYNTSDGVYIGLTNGSSNPLKIYEGVKEIGAADFVDYVVSDSPTAYPDGGEQDGYWYEKAIIGGCKTYSGSITLASVSPSIEISNPFGKKDKVKAIFLSCFSSSSFGRGDTAYYNVETETTFRAIYAGREQIGSCTITNETITITFGTLDGETKNFDKNTYSWEVIGNA